MTEKNIPITQYAYDVLAKRRKELTSITERKTVPNVEEQREMNVARKELAEIDEIFEPGFVRDFNEKQPAMVQIGAVVTLENMATGDKREYRIMTRTTADPLNGVISNESPIAQKMLGLNLKNTFKFKDNYGQEDSYKIISIE